MTKVPSQYKFQRIFWALSVTCLVLGGLYLGLVGKTVANVLERQQTEKMMSEASIKVSELEFSYLNTKSSVNAALARSLGFVETSKTLVAKKAGNLSFSLKNEI